MREKFGLWKIHNHFNITDEQVFHESTNNEKQISVLNIINKKDLPENAYPTNWSLSKDLLHKPLQWCCDWSAKDLIVE